MSKIHKKSGQNLLWKALEFSLFNIKKIKVNCKKGSFIPFSRKGNDKDFVDKNYSILVQLLYYPKEKKLWNWIP